MKKVYTGVDVFKLLAAFGIVAIHSNLIFFKTIGRLGVPFFVMISSFFFFKKYFNLNNTQKRARLIHFEKRILYLLLCWDVLYLPLSIYYLVNELKNRGGYRAYSSFICLSLYSSPC